MAPWKQISLAMHLPGLVLCHSVICYGLPAGLAVGLRLADLTGINTDIHTFSFCGYYEKG